jgi:hypothetical protein
MELTGRAHEPVAALKHEEAMEHRSQSAAQSLHVRKSVWNSFIVAPAARYVAAIHVPLSAQKEGDAGEMGAIGGIPSRNKVRGVI